MAISRGDIKYESEDFVDMSWVCEMILYIVSVWFVY